MKGEILYVENFVFGDGGRSPKIVLVLNEPKPDDPYLLILTTSQKGRKEDREGCHSKDFYYVLRKGIDWFDEPLTWVMFDDIKEMLFNQYTEWLSQRSVQSRGHLKPQTLAAISNCVRNSVDVSYFVKNLLKP